MEKTGKKPLKIVVFSDLHLNDGSFDQAVLNHMIARIRSLSKNYEVLVIYLGDFLNPGDIMDISLMAQHAGNPSGLSAAVQTRLVIERRSINRIIKLIYNNGGRVILALRGNEDEHIRNTYSFDLFEDLITRNVPVYSNQCNLVISMKDSDLWIPCYHKLKYSSNYKGVLTKSMIMRHNDQHSNLFVGKKIIFHAHAVLQGHNHVGHINRYEVPVNDPRVGGVGFYSWVNIPSFKNEVRCGHASLNLALGSQPSGAGYAELSFEDGILTPELKTAARPDSKGHSLAF